MFLNLSMGTISGPIFDVHGIKKIIIVGMILNCGGLYATAFSTELWYFIVSFGIVAGIVAGFGSGMMLNPIVGVVSHWFLKNRSWANGFSACGSVSGVFFPIMLRQLFLTIGYVKTMVIFASICVLLCMLAFFMVEDKSDILHRESSHIPKRKRLLDAYKNMLNINNFREKSYSFLVFGMFFDEFSIMLVTSYIATYGAVRNLGESTTYLIVTVMNAAGIAGKIISSYLADKIGKFKVMIIILITMVISFNLVTLL